MKSKAFTILILILILASCLFSGCLGGDKIVGTWQSESGEIIITFNKNGTYILTNDDGTNKGKWEKSGDQYLLYNDLGLQLVKAHFIGEDLRLTANVFGFTVNTDYKRIK